MYDIAQIERELRETVQGMTPTAKAVWNECLTLIRTEESTEQMLEKITPILDQLQPDEQAEVFEANRLETQRQEALVAEVQGEGRLLRQLEDICVKAMELEPSLSSKGLTVSKALEVLERHGVKHGISPEALEIGIEVPPKKRR